MNVIDTEKPDGVLVQFGGQTPLNVAQQLYEAGAPIWGTSIESINMAEDREAFNAFMHDLDIPQPEGRTARSKDELIAAVDQIGFPVLVRPSFVLGGRGMAICFDYESLNAVLNEDINWD